ncbi:hypothetical protein RT717_25675 [Imperialibacter roseus]|uniref:Rieske domain-containing protein n=1 Tax=Imperialibacter roseus TaxID=1324217 RepID=A0ABZ0IN74_9BACT|nr:hypothetical protein [Imperialibacter roseus]WOK06469.1 hypothetical protein RT717_25675 [Imperialibacter roseus]
MSRLASVFGVLAVVLIFAQCSESNTGPNIPPKIVNIEINLSNLQYQSLRQVGGFVYLSGGNKGLIVYRQSQSEYRVWDRICTYGPGKECEVVTMNSSGFYMEDLCCKSTFDLDGYPTAGPAKYPLVEYRAVSDGTFLYISN